jgi:hypothetical protein
MKFTMGSVAKGLTKATLSGTGWLISKAIRDSEKQKAFQEKASNLSEKISNGVETCVDTIIITSGKTSGYVCKQTAKVMGASPENVQRAEKIGNAVGKIAVGGGIGVAASAALISAAAASGTAGAAAFTSGLATLGGGNVAAGGLGMVGGKLVVGAVTAATTASAVNTKSKDNKKGEDSDAERPKE